MAEMTSPTRAPSAAPALEPGRRWRPRNVLQPALRVIAEAGWITVVYSALAVMSDKQPPTLGPIEIVLFVAAGALIGRFGRAHTDLGPAVLIVGVVLGGVIGWLASPEARDALPDFAVAASSHLGGWLMGIAVLRGAIVRTDEKAAEDLECGSRSPWARCGEPWLSCARLSCRSAWPV
jgi:hypothetical protein